ncbi:MAG: SPOR domain-containing protein [Candidatus Omnitrophota bacterium]|jgi:hypothetical protein
MENKNNPQFDLFTQGRASAGGIPHDSPERIFAIRKYEKILLLSISFIVTIIISFSLGVEKGKRILALKSRAGFDAALARKAFPAPQRTSPPLRGMTVSAVQKKTVTAPLAPVKTVPVTAAAAAPAQIPAPAPAAVNAAGSFTIQLATFKTKASAQREKAALQQTGHPVYVTSKGKYTVLSIGNFSDKEAATPFLSELKKNYQDCFIRRL